MQYKFEEEKKLIYGDLSQVFEMSSLRLLGNIFDLQILLGERSGTFRDSGVGVILQLKHLNLVATH